MHSEPPTAAPGPGDEPAIDTAGGSAPRSGHGPVPFAERTRPLQAMLAIAVPAALGAVAGVLLGISTVAYVVISVLAGVGAYVSGFEHHGGWDGADRGAVAGGSYGVALLVAHAIAGTRAKVALGSFPPALIVVTALVGALLTAAGAIGRQPPAADRGGAADRAHR